MTDTTSGGTSTRDAAASPTRPTRRPTSPPAPEAPIPAPAAGVPRTLSIRLPLVTITFGPQPTPPVPAPAPRAAPGPRGATLERLAFYGGVAAAGVVGAIEWPVAVAAGTWVAQHTLPAPRSPSDAAPAEGTSRTESSVAAGPTGTPAGAGAAGRR